MKDVVSKFAGENTNFDLEITVGNVEGGFGTLNSTPGSNTFQMKIDQEGLLQRKSIQTAATFLHEAIHAEMRRYLRGATDTSTLSGFPGSFSHDWNLFINEFYNGDVGEAEHEAMAVKYRDVIVDGLKEYDNDALSTNEYKTLAWLV